MIEFATDNTKPLVRRMWEICFNDDLAFVDLYFSEKYRNENTLILFEGSEAVASIQFLPYTFTFYNIEIPVSYISGACTLPEYRNRGYMGKLLAASFEVMQERDIPLSILIPAEDWLYGYYAKYGYETVFEKDDVVIPLKKIIEETQGDVDAAYSRFDEIFRTKHFCVQKSKADFIAILKDAELDNFPDKTNLSGMARIIDAARLLSFYAEKNKDAFFICSVDDCFLKKNNRIYKVEAGTCVEVNDSVPVKFHFNIALLCRLLFGFHLAEFQPEVAGCFAPHRPVMNYMLE